MQKNERFVVLVLRSLLVCDWITASMRALPRAFRARRWGVLIGRRARLGRREQKNKSFSKNGRLLGLPSIRGTSCARRGREGGSWDTVRPRSVLSSRRIPHGARQDALNRGLSLSLPLWEASATALSKPASTADNLLKSNQPTNPNKSVISRGSLTGSTRGRPQLPGTRERIRRFHPPQGQK